MKVKLELESVRVKGVSFHASRPWVLYSTHAGTVHVHDYDVGVELQRYSVTQNEPVRCVAFHPTQALFACGTDGHSVVVYNWQRRLRLFSLQGHFDFVRSVEFHPVLPLLLSASDDSSARIWNWQSRCCIAVLEDHTYFVMCARFNAARTLVATACMDDCVRVFNVNALFQTSMSRDVDASFFSMDSSSTMTSELEEHADGATCVAWNQGGNRLASCGEDRTVKVFTIIGDEAVLMRTLTHHAAAVTAVAFHPQTGSLVSASEDGALCVFDGAAFRLTARHDVGPARLWCCACHPKDALVAAGHDRGLVILKLAKERPPYDVQGDTVLWRQDGELHVIDVVAKATERAAPARQGIKSVAWNPARHIALVSYAADDGDRYEIVELRKTGTPDSREGASAVWLSRSMVAAIAPSKERLLVCEVGGASVRQVAIPRTSRIFAAMTQKVYLVGRNSIALFDVNRAQAVGEVPFGQAQLVVFDDQRENICARSSTQVLTARADLSQYSIFHESCKVKSCCWWGSAVLYTTRTHLKYIVGSTSGVVCSLPRVLYIIRASGELAWFINRDGLLFKREIEMSEVHLKIALSQGKSDDLARRIVGENRPIGLSILEFAARNGRYEIAAALATDPAKRFEMTLRAGDLDAAAAIADDIGDRETFKKLSQAALEVGRFALAEVALKKAEDYENLAFLYLISGESEKLRRLSKQTNSLLHQLWTNDNDAIARTLAAAAPELECDLTDANALRVSPGAAVLADWPMTRSGFIHTTIAPALPDDDEAGAAWESGPHEEDDAEPGGWDVDVDIPPGSPGTPGRAHAQFIPPPRGTSVHQRWAERAQTAGERIAAGLFGDALALLRETVAVRNSDALRDLFVETYLSANAAVAGPGGQIPIPISLPYRGGLSPGVPSNLELFENLTKSLYALFVKGKFIESRQLCVGIIRRVLVTTVSTKDEEQRVLEALETAKNYCLAVSMELKRKTEASAARGLEIALYMTHVRLAPPHLRIVLHSAMRAAIKAENFLSTVSAATRLLDLAPPEKLAA
jgi:coatomer protein complex subunit alpha (xenin)